MLRTALTPICPVCRPTARPTGQLRGFLFPPIKSQQQQQQQRSMGMAHRKTPSRMVLSDTVSRPPPSREPARRREAGPWSGMNRTVANIRERPGVRATPSRTGRSGTLQAEASNQEQGQGDYRGGPIGGRAFNHNNRKKPFKALRMQQSLATIGYGQRTQIKSRMGDMGDFAQFKLLPSLQEGIQSEALRGLVDVKPTPIQRLAIPALLGQVADRRASRQYKPEDQREFLLAAETGSGKTLAYLLPVIDALKRAEAADPDIIAYKQRIEIEKERRANDPKLRWKKMTPGSLEPHPSTARPRVIVLVPSAELVDQVGQVAKALSHAVKFKTDLLSANVSPKVMERNLYSPMGIDMIVATPHLLASIADSDPNILSRVSHLVIDEADSLFDRSFSPATTAILDRARPSLKQLILCSATIPRRLDQYMVQHFPKMQRITTPNLHAIPRRVQLGVIDVAKEPYQNNKNLACADAIWSIGKDTSQDEPAAMSGGEADIKRIMVFVNEREKAAEVAEFLRGKGIDAVALHRDSNESRHSDTLAVFMSADRLTLSSPLLKSAPAFGSANLPPRGPGGRILTNTKVIVATDLASRGIDTLGVRHVVLYDVPHTTIDFIHRLGRAGRMGRRGRGIVLVGKEDRRDIVAEVRESMYMGQALV